MSTPIDTADLVSELNSVSRCCEMHHAIIAMQALKFRAATAIKALQAELAALKRLLTISDRQVNEYISKCKALESHLAAANRKLEAIYARVPAAFAVTYDGEVNFNIFPYIEEATETHLRLNKKYPIGVESRKIMELIIKPREGEST